MKYSMTFSTHVEFIKEVEADSPIDAVTKIIKGEGRLIKDWECEEVEPIKLEDENDAEYPVWELLLEVLKPAISSEE